jgi:hypothetical protein
MGGGGRPQRGRLLLSAKRTLTQGRGALVEQDRVDALHPRRVLYDKKLAEGKPPKEALRSLKRQVSGAIFARLQADARRAATRAEGPGGQQGNDSVASVADSHPRHRLFGQATPGPSHHTTTAAGSSAAGPARKVRSGPIAPQPDSARSRAGHSSIADTTPPPAKPQVQVERPQPSEDDCQGTSRTALPRILWSR